MPSGLEILTNHHANEPVRVRDRADHQNSVLQLSFMEIIRFGCTKDGIVDTCLQAIAVLTSVYYERRKTYMTPFGCDLHRSLTCRLLLALSTQRDPFGNLTLVTNNQATPHSRVSLACSCLELPRTSRSELGHPSISK